MIIDGKKLAENVLQSLKKIIDEEKIVPVLAVISVGKDKASQIYVRNKEKAAAEIGVKCDVYSFSDDVSQQELENLVLKLNCDKAVNGIIIQQPLPKALDGDALLDLISPQKDVDGFGVFNAGRLLLNEKGGLVAATPKGILRMLESTGETLAGKHAVIIGRSKIVGRPLAALLFGRVRAFEAYGRGVDEQFGAGQGHEPCALGVPLVPADLHAEAPDRRVDGAEAEVAGREVELLVVGGVVGDVHLAVAAGQRAVRLEHDGGVVVQARRAALEERRDEHHAVAPRQGGVMFGGGAGDGLGQVEVVRVLRLAEVERVVELLKHDEACALAGEAPDGLGQAGAIVGDVGRVGLLYDADA